MDSYKTYEVTINFNGLIDCDETYMVDAKSEEEAKEEALQRAIEDLYVQSVKVEEN